MDQILEPIQEIGDKTVNILLLLLPRMVIKRYNTYTLISYYISNLVTDRTYDHQWVETYLMTVP